MQRIVLHNHITAQPRDLLSVKDQRPIALKLCIAVKEMYITVQIQYLRRLLIAHIHPVGMDQPEFLSISFLGSQTEQPQQQTTNP